MILCFLCLVRILICHLHLAVLIKPRCILVCTQTSRLCAFVVVLPVNVLADLGWINRDCLSASAAKISCVSSERNSSSDTASEDFFLHSLLHCPADHLQSQHPQYLQIHRPAFPVDFPLCCYPKNLPPKSPSLLDHPDCYRMIPPLLSSKESVSSMPADDISP